MNTAEMYLADLIREGKVEARRRADGVWEYRTIRPPVERHPEEEPVIIGEEPGMNR